MIDWISTKDKLPDKAGLYYTCWAFSVGHSREQHQGIRYFNGQFWAGINIVVTHWTDLPDLPT